MNNHVTLIYLEWIGLLVIAQLYVIGVLGVATLFLLRWRTWKTKRLEILKEAYGESIADVVAGDAELFIYLPRRFDFIRRQALKEALLDNIGSITGPERAVLVEAYISLGLAALDEKNCRSKFWPKRLHGLLSLAQLQRNDFAELFHALKGDKQPLVSSCAILSLSYINDLREQPETVLDNLPPAFFTNSNMLLELTENLVSFYGLERFEDYVSDRAETQVGRAIISVLTNAGTPEAAIFLVQILTTKKLDDARLALRIERAVRESNDPVAIAQLDYFQTSRGEKRLGAA